MKQSLTQCGFAIIDFTDRYDSPCNIQKSSLATEDAIWLGVADANPIIMASQAAAHGVATSEACGWVQYPVPNEVSMTTRMHLTREQVAELLPVLQHFADTGELPQ